MAVNEVVSAHESCATVGRNAVGAAFVKGVAGLPELDRAQAMQAAAQRTVRVGRALLRGAGLPWHADEAQTAATVAMVELATDARSGLPECGLNDLLAAYRAALEAMAGD